MKPTAPKTRYEICGEFCNPVLSIEYHSYTEELVDMIKNQKILEIKNVNNGGLNLSNIIKPADLVVISDIYYHHVASIKNIPNIIFIDAINNTSDLTRNELVQNHKYLIDDLLESLNNKAFYIFHGKKSENAHGFKEKIDFLKALGFRACPELETLHRKFYVRNKKAIIRYHYK